MGSESKRHAPRLGIFVGGLFVVCTLLAGLSVLQAYVCDLGLGQPASLGPLLRQEFKDWYSLGLISVGVIWFAGRNRIESGRASWVATHFAGAAVFAGMYALLTSWLVAGERSVMHPGQILTFSYLIRNYWLHYTVVYLVMYWLVVFAHLGWQYYLRYQEREVETAQLQRELVEARLEALRMQLNPHFLFNTLHAISGLIHDSPETADRIMARLSELLRLTLDQTKPQEVPLSEELAFLDRYLEIEQTRFAERLKIEKQISPEAQQALVPYLILQPLVENAIRHGIEPREEMGLLQICACRNDGRLELRVRDNGNGLAGKADPPGQEGIGLSNTRSRLGHLYGKNFRLELASPAGGGLEALVEIPFHTKKTGSSLKAEGRSRSGLEVHPG